MSVPRQTRLPWALLALLAAGALASSTRADEIRLNDGKKLYGVIVAYEDNMFKVKTDFGYVLVEKDKIASIIPDTPAQPAADKTGSTQRPATAAARNDIAGTTPPKPSAPAAPDKHEKAAAIVNHANARPELPVVTKTAADANPPALKTAAATPKATLAVTPTSPPPPKEEPP